MLPDSEAERIYKDLLETLQSTKCGWVVDQVDQELRSGKVSSKSVRVVREISKGEYKPASGPRSDFTSTEDYTKAESLKLLLEAIRQALVKTVDIESEVVNFLTRDGSNQSQITFYSEEKGEETLTISQDTSILHRETAGALEEVIERFLEELKE